MNDHLDALELRLSHERVHLAKAKGPCERELRGVWIAQIEKEIAREKAFLGIDDLPIPAMSDDELLRALSE